MHELEKEFIGKVLTEASLNYADQVQKMTDWHFGRRKQNLNMSDDKLEMNYNICVSKGFDNEAKTLLDIGVQRSLPWAIRAKNVTNGITFTADDFRVDIAQRIKNSLPQDIVRQYINFGTSPVKKGLIYLIIALIIGQKDSLKVFKDYLMNEKGLSDDNIRKYVGKIKTDTAILSKLQDIKNNINESLEEDTVKVKDHKWTNKGAEGTHGNFTTKKAADAQRKAMFANGYHESLEEGLSVDYMISKLREWGKNYNFGKYSDAQIYNIYMRELDKVKNAPEKEEKPFEFKHRDSCPNCGAVLNDAGECPVCDLGDETALEEDIEKHDTLNPKLWNSDNTLKREVKEKVLDIVNEFEDGLKEDGIKFVVDDIILVGSNCSYNYTKDSDLDIHIIADIDEFECPDNLYPLVYSAYRSLFNKKFDIDFYGIPVEIYVELKDEPVKSNGIYSVLTDTWIKEPVQADIPDIDKEIFDKEFKVWEDRYNDIVKDSDVKLEEEVQTKVADSVKGTNNAELVKYFKNAIEAKFGKDTTALVGVNAKNEFVFVAEGLTLINIKEDIVDAYCKKNNLDLDVIEYSKNKLLCKFIKKAVGVAKLTESADVAKSIIADQIRGEWEAIRNYEKAIDDLRLQDHCENCDDIIDILNSIADEEEVHVGELQKAQSLLDDNVLDNIDQGEEEADEHISETANDLENESLTEEVSNDKIEAVDKFLTDIYELRREGLADEGEYSIGNLVFKEVRNKGYLDNLKELKNQLIGKELSLESKTVLAHNEDNTILKEKYLSNRDIYEARQRLSRAIHDQVIVDTYGNFHVYNVKEADVNHISSILRNVEGVTEVRSYASGKYDFDRIDIHGVPSRYFTIDGKIEL